MAGTTGDRDSDSHRIVILLVGGTDPSGGAGLAADIKAAAAMGVHGSIAVTAVTVQNSGGVRSWFSVSPEEVTSQIEAVCDDGPIGAIKSGMLASPDTVKVLSDILKNRLDGIPYVLDPVLEAGSGASLGTKGLMDAVRKLLVPLASVCTPNLDEASKLAGIPVTNRQQMIDAGRIIQKLGARTVLVKGGHLSGEPADVLISDREPIWFPGTRILPETVHGTGCTLASSIAALMTVDVDTEAAVESALLYLKQTLGDRFTRKSGVLLGHFPSRGPLPDHANGEAFYGIPRFCSRCSGQLMITEALQSHLHCPTCGLVHYRNPLPAVTLLVSSDDRILLVKRSRPPCAGQLSLPGGFLEHGETILECGKRELKEETGIDAEDCRLFSVETDNTGYGGVMLAVLEIISWTGVPEAGDDASEIIWKPISEVPDLAFSAHNRIIRRFAKKCSLKK